MIAIAKGRLPTVTGGPGVLVAAVMGVTLFVD